MTSLDMERKAIPPLAIGSLVTLLTASVAIRVLPFRHLFILTCGSRTRACAPAPFVEDLSRALRGWGRRLPWRTLCFEQGLAAHWMLQFYGFASTLYYGAATIEGVLTAHVWVRSGDRDVVGCEIAPNFAVLSRFSNDSSSSPVQP